MSLCSTHLWRLECSQAIALLLRELGEKQEVHIQIVSMYDVLWHTYINTRTCMYCSQVCDSLINYVTVNNDAISPGASKDKEVRHPE